MNKWIITGLTLVLVVLATAAPDTAPADDKAAPIVLITGANRGIGLEFARQYKRDGWYVIGTARKPDEAADLRALGATVLQLDVVDAASVAALAKQLEGKPIDMLINNAGILPYFSTLAETDFDTVARILDVNLIGPMRVTKALLPNLAAGRQKKVINITSGLGSIAGNDFGQFYGYRESKAGLNMFSKTLAMELADQGFTSIAIHPGWVRTDMGGPEAPLTPEASVDGMRGVIDNLTPENNGSFWGVEGAEVDW